MKTFFLNFFVILLINTSAYSYAENLACLPNKNLRLPQADKSAKAIKKVVTDIKKIKLAEFPTAFNPSLLKIKKGYLLTFRYTDKQKPWINYIGAVLLDKKLEPRGKPCLLTTREDGSPIPSQSEDARVFSFRDEIYLIFNDNLEYENPSIKERRDMHIAKLSIHNDGFVVSKPLKIFHNERYRDTLWQKNWVPFVWKDQLLFSYSLNPHEVLYPNLDTGLCHLYQKTYMNVDWQWGNLRGGTPALLVDGQYLAFFHSSSVISSEASKEKKMRHYYMGAYTFAAEPPFNITKISISPILEEKFYVSSNFHIRVVYPGGFVVSGSKIYIAYGKDDGQMRIATIDKNRLYRMLKPVQ